jgi:16S rRNA G966 N2-methylase RsmD
LNLNILNTDNQKFIEANLNSDIISLLLSKNSFDSVTLKELVEQIEAKNKCKNKLPTWHNAKNIYYPNKLNIEQTSSEIAAEYKSLMTQGKSLIDITGGFGVDSFYFAKQCSQVTHCEVDEHLSKIVEYNYQTLGVDNVNCVSGNGIEHLQHLNTPFDWIYIDPSRRHNSKGKVFFLSDCQPDVTKHFDVFFEHSKNILIKTSPMLDISVALKELKFVKEIHILAIKNEVKELLFSLKKNFDKEISIHTINIDKNDEYRFDFELPNEISAFATYSLPKKFLYEPNNAVLKAGAFNSISSMLNLDKLHKHSHLYTSDSIKEFPGKCFEVTKILPYVKKNITKHCSNKQYNVVIRNFPETVAQIRKKFKIKDGGEFTLFFTTNCKNEKIVIETKRLKK